MSDDNDLLKQRKESLLSELESIKYILGETGTIDIPILDNVVIEETEPTFENRHPTRSHQPEPHTSIMTKAEALASSLENTLSTKALPSQQSSFRGSFESVDANDPVSTINNAATSSSSFKTAQRITTPYSIGSNSSLAQNPFLPPHVRKRFQESSTNSTPDQEAKITPSLRQNSAVKTSYTEQLIDQLIAHHLPKIEAELRQKLLKVVNTHNERVKK